MQFIAARALPLTVYCLVLLAALLLSAIFFAKKGKNPAVYLLIWVVYAIASAATAVFLAADPFDWINLLCISIFLGGPILLSISANYAAHFKLKLLSCLSLLLALIVVACAVDAFYLEPHDLCVDRIEIASAKVPELTKIAVISDIQTDQVGDFEDMVLQKTMAEKPDLIILPGDYVQCLDANGRKREQAKLNQLFKKNNVSAPQGCFAVSGNVEVGDSSWQDIFKNTKISPIRSTQSFVLFTTTLTALSFEDSFNKDLKIPQEDRYHIVFGHGPDFALAAPSGDLYIAGHTHGGQVQLPSVGPLLTLSAVPAQWGGGFNPKVGPLEIAPGKLLIVSRGIGMERCYAPRLRFLCRPQLLFITLKPGQKGPDVK
jgi:predicted MPP superfamily phosphohydrolase